LLADLPVSVVRYPARFLPFAILGLAALAVMGWDRIRPRRRWVDLILVFVIAADLLFQGRALFHDEPFRRHPVPYDASIGASSKILRLGEVNVLAREAWISGYLNLYDRRFDAFTPAPLIVERYLRYYEALVRKPVHAELASGAVGFTVTRQAMPKPFFRVAQAGDAFVFRTGYPTPMAAHIWREPLTMKPAHWSLDTSSARVTIDAPHDGVLVLRQQQAKGWSVTVDGKPAESLLIDGVYRGVNLVKGKHEVVWRYRPQSLLTGALMTIVTLASLASRVFVK
jgi:hypothetical protein